MTDGDASEDASQSDRARATALRTMVMSRDHLTQDHGGGLGCNPERGEAYCRHCRCRVTVDGSGVADVEYGHASGCPARPEDWPRTGQFLTTPGQHPTATQGGAARGD